MKGRKIRLSVAVALTLLVIAIVAGVMRSSASGSMAGARQGTFEKVAEGATEQYAAGKNEDRSPAGTAEAQEAYWRAYPSSVDEISIDATLRARSAFQSVKSRQKHAPGSWQLIGPSSATYPGVLNVLNDGDQYVASGRTIAMAIEPNCSKARCRLWIGAAGGGVTDRGCRTGAPPSFSGQELPAVTPPSVFPSPLMP